MGGVHEHQGRLEHALHPVAGKSGSRPGYLSCRPRKPRRTTYACIRAKKTDRSTKASHGQPTVLVGSPPQLAEPHPGNTWQLPDQLPPTFSTEDPPFCQTRCPRPHLRQHMTGWPSGLRSDGWSANPGRQEACRFGLADYKRLRPPPCLNACRAAN